MRDVVKAFVHQHECSVEEVYFVEFRKRAFEEFLENVEKSVSERDLQFPLPLLNTLYRVLSLLTFFFNSIEKSPFKTIMLYKIKIDFVCASGLVFLVFADQTKKSLLPNEITTLDTVRALFVRAFPDLSLEMLESPRRKIYILDPATSIYFQLEDLA